MTEVGKGDLWDSRVRGLLLGLALGDAVGGDGGTTVTEGTLRSGVSTQLAAFTVEGLIRAIVRQHHRGVCHPASVLWHSYSRWAAMQGLEPDTMARRWSTDGGIGAWPDGWLAQVPLLAERRGSAPATVAALKQPQAGTIEHPTTRSRGCHALLRTLPAAAMSAVWDSEELEQEVQQYAALTHGDPSARWATSAAVRIVAGCLSGLSIEDALWRTDSIQMGSYLGRAVDMARHNPRDQKWLATIAPDATAESAFYGAVYVAQSFSRPADAMQALQFAATAPDGVLVAAVTGALVGASHGVDVWPVAALCRLDLAWVLDTLARDLALQLTDNPAGGGFTPPRDPNWWHRYPGW